MNYPRLLGLGILTAALVLLPHNYVQGQGKKPAGPATDSDQLPPGEYVGMLKALPGSDRNFTIEIESARLVPSGGQRGGNNQNQLLRTQLQLQQAQAQMARARTPQQRMQAMRRMQQIQLQMQRAAMQAQRGGGGGIPPGYKLEKTKVAVDFQLNEKAKIRTLVLPETFDEKGNLKKYSPKELSELKGSDRSAPGYEFSAEQLQVGQMVRVVTASVGKQGGGAGLSKERDDDLVDEKNKQVKLLVVLTAADPSAARGKK